MIAGRGARSRQVRGRLAATVVWRRRLFADDAEVDLNISAIRAAWVVPKDSVLQREPNHRDRGAIVDLNFPDRAAFTDDSVAAAAHAFLSGIDASSRARVMLMMQVSLPTVAADLRLGTPDSSRPGCQPRRRRCIPVVRREDRLEASRARIMTAVQSCGRSLLLLLQLCSKITAQMLAHVRWLLHTLLRCSQRQMMVMVLGRSTFVRLSELLLRTDQQTCILVMLTTATALRRKHGGLLTLLADSEIWRRT